MWNLYLLAREYSSRPSAMLGIDDAWAAYQLDLACLQLARYVESELNKKRTLNQILTSPVPGAAGARSEHGGYSSFRQLGAVRTMPIPEDGIW